MKKTISKFFDMDGSITRKQFVLRYIVIFISGFIWAFIGRVFTSTIDELALNGFEININIVKLFAIVYVIIAILILVSGISLQLRRLDDLNLSRLFIIFLFLPPISILYLLFLMLAKSKSKYKNTMKSDEAEMVDTEFSFQNDSVSMDSTEFRELMSSEDSKTLEKDPENDIRVEEKLSPIKSDMHYIDSSIEESSNNIKHKNKRISKSKIIIVLSCLIVIISLLYFNFFYYPHNGTWVADFYSRTVILRLENGEGQIRWGDGSSTQKVILYEPNRRETTAGIDGRSNNIKVKGKVLILELSNVYIINWGEMDEVLYFKKR